LMSREKPIIVMADDDDDDCMLATEAFEESRAEGVFSCVQDGLELMDYLLRSSNNENETHASLPALILLDLNMPRKDGREVLKEIKSDPAFQNIPIVVLSTSREEEDIAFSLRMGANFFITKPATFDEWVEMIQSLARDWLSTDPHK